MWLLPFLACTGDVADSGSAPVDTCRAPSVEILAPVEGDTVVEGERVTFEGDGDGQGQLLYVWGVDGDSSGTGTSSGWTAAGVGSHLVTLQLTDDCEEPAQATVHISVTAP